MTVKVCFEAQLRVAAGVEFVEVPLTDGDSVADVLRAASVAVPASVSDRLFAEDGSVRTSLLIFWNEIPVSARQCSTEGARTGDTIVVCPPIAGG
ncbi:MAG: hypothetical protein KDA96_08315 [Planctomycetaceae bacterium]|nr:hypothetical protein [Planctomycetaceae bacterium]